jgi:hypothetical protein
VIRRQVLQTQFVTDDGQFRDANDDQGRAR